MSAWTERAPTALRAAVALVLLACGAGSDRPLRPDVLLVTFDTLRADHCSLYGYERRTTPQIDALAAEGVRFERAYAPSATTAPSISSLMTSLHPTQHGVDRNATVLAPRHDTLAEHLARAGYATRAVISSIVVAGRFGLRQGFEVYDDDMRGSEATLQLKRYAGGVVPGGKTDRRADAATDRALAQIDSRPAQRPLFLWVHYMDPHEPYDPPAAFGDPFGAADLPPRSLQRAIASYDTEIAFSDAQLGRLVAHFEAAARSDGALIAIGADHGEGFLDHGWRGHGPQLYEEAVRTPLVFRWMGQIPAGRSIDVPVSLLDVAPTLLGLLGIEFESAGFAGRDLGQVLRGASSELELRPIFFERARYERAGRLEPIPLYEMGRVRFGAPLRVRGEKFGVRVGRWKYLEAPGERRSRELYDLRADPGERLNLVTAEPGQADRLAGILAAWRQGLARAPRSTPAPVAGPDREALEALGYFEPTLDPSNGSSGPGNRSRR